MDRHPTLMDLAVSNQYKTFSNLNSISASNSSGRQLPNLSHLSLSVTGPNSPSSDSDNDTLASTDTEMSQIPEDDVWHPKQVAQLSQLSQRLGELSQAQSEKPSISTLPTEIVLQIFSYLDKIDSCCLGLTSRRHYEIYISVHGIKMPLTTRRSGPNVLESAWEAQLVGVQQCAQCGIYRCELHQHLKTWMPKELEYCSFKQNFGLRAGEDATQGCFRGKPSKPHRCGRHPLRTTSVHQDDTAVSKL